MQDRSEDVNLVPLWQAIADGATEEVPMIMKALGALVVAAIGFGARHLALVAAVRREAIKAEREVGPGDGPRKHSRVRDTIKETWPMSRVTKIDQLITTQGAPAANRDREKRESLMPPEMRSKPPSKPPEPPN